MDQRLTGDEPIDAATFRTALGHYASGITIVTGFDAERPVGFTCQSFHSVSLVPPLVSFSVMRDSTSYPPMRAAGRFAVNVLAHDQHGIASRFARKGTEKFAGIEWTTTRAANPKIGGALLWLDCRLEAEHEAGDHLMVIGRVTSVGPGPDTDGSPLIFFRGRYRHLRGPAGETL